MKRKIFSSLLLVAFLCASMSMFVSCKDYEDDINANKDDITALQNQLADLQTTLANELSSVRSELSTQISNAKAELQAAIDQKADQATVTALEARVAALEGDLAAKEAALNAKIDAVNEAVTGLNGRLETVESTLATIVAMTGDFTALQQTVNDLKGRVEALEGLDIAAIAKEAVAKDLETQQKALEAFKQEIADADYQGQINKLQDQIDALPTAADLKDLADKLEAYDIENLEKRISDAEAAIADLKSSLSDYATVTSVNELEQALQKQIDDLNTTINGVSENVNTLTVFVDKMLTSISLVPDLYVGGIESIEFRVLEYTPAVPGTSGLTRMRIMPIYVDNGQTTATYRLNPSSVARENLDEENIDFVAATAETRAVLENSPVTFNGIESFKNGLMTVKLKKTSDATLELGDNRTYIVALKVPRYNSDKETTTDIYSENSRLVQTTFTPRIAKLEWDTTNPLHHFSTKEEIYASKVDAGELVTAEIYYNETKNLADFVTGCYLNAGDEETQITKDELKKYGLALRFSIPEDVYNTAAPNETNQQTFATVTPEGVISSKLPDGVTNNMACVGKEPIVCVTLVDTTKTENNLVDERYMKIKWTQKMLDDVTLDDKADVFTLGCDDLKAELTWEWLITKVYAKVQAQGLDQATFEQIYPEGNITWTPANTNNGTEKDILEFKDTDNENGDALAATWVMSPDFIGDITKDGSKTFTKVITFKSTMPAQYPDLKMKWTVTVKLPTLPSIAGYFDTYWFEKYNIYDVLPVQYGTDAAQGHTIVRYYNNLTSAFGYTKTWGNDNFFIKDMTKCGTWDLQFSADQTIAGYTVNSTDLDEAGIAKVDFSGYLLKKGVLNSARLEWTNRDASWGTTFDTDATPYLYVPENREDTWDLINPLAQADEKGIPARTHDKKISVSVWAKINGYNKVLVKKYDVCLIAPIRLDAVSKGGFEEGIVSGSTVDAGKLVSITDFRGYAVAQTAIGNPTEFEKYAVQLWKYYDVKSIFFDLSKAKYTLAVNGGSVVANNDLSYADAMTAAKLSELTNKAVNLSLSQSGNYITFKNNGGSNVEEMFYVYIPVTVEYAYGKLTEYVKIPVYPRGQVPASVKRR